MDTWENRRLELRQLVKAILSSEVDGRLTNIEESASIEFKEEAGRRSGSGLEPGQKENLMAATKLADEVACLANSPGGGVLILGVEDRTGQILGTNLDREWLQYRIYQGVSVAPAIDEHQIAGQRILVLYVAQAREPVENTSGQLRWRVRDACVPVDRAEWWTYQDELQERDDFALPTRLGVSDISPEVLAHLREVLPPFEVEESPKALLHRLGALRSDGFLSRAGALLFCPSRRPNADLELTVLDVPGGRVLNQVFPNPRAPLLLQIQLVEQALATLNAFADSREGFSGQPLRQIPQSAVREAVLNGLIHRDWNQTEATAVQWITQDASLVVQSPGGFTGGISADNIISSRHARHPALADLFRAMHLVEKQGLGVDRMYQAMIVQGHRPPRIVETVGPRVTCTLTGGESVFPIVQLMSEIRPEVRSRDYRVAMILNRLFRWPYVTVDAVAALLQADRVVGETALAATSQTVFRGAPLLRGHRDVWLLGRPVIEFLARANVADFSQKLVPYWTTDSELVEAAARFWLADHRELSSTDLMELTGISRGSALAVLKGMEGSGELSRVGQGRATRYRMT